MNHRRYIFTFSLLFCLLIVCCPAMAQSNSADDIKQLEKAMYQYYSAGKTQELFSTIEQLKAKCLETGNERLFYKAWGNEIIHTSVYIGRNEAFKKLEEMREYAEQHNSKYGLYTSTFVTGNMQNGAGDLNKASENYQKAIEYLKHYFPNESYASSYIALSSIEDQRRNNPGAIAYARQALKDPHISKLHRTMAWSHICTAWGWLRNKEEFDKAYAERQKAVEALGHEDNLKTHVECFRAFVHQDVDKALEYAAKIPNKLNRLRLVYKLKQWAGRDKEALYAYQEYIAEVNAKTNKEIREKASIYQSQLEVAKAENESKDLRLANQQLKLNHIADELKQKKLTEQALNLMLKNRDIELAHAAVRLENDSLEAHNKNLKLSEYLSKMKAQEQAEHNQRIIMWAGAFIALLTIGYLAFFLYRRNRHAKRLEDANQKLQTAYDQLEEITTARERMRSELRIARDIQMGMVPQKFPHNPAFDLYATMVPAKAVGGDLYDFFLLNDKLYFCIGDVSGKGIPASMLMAVAVNLFRTIAKEELPPEHIANKLNDTLSADNESGMFVTMFIGIIDLPSGRMDFCNAGHNPPLMDGKYIEMESNAPIGLWPEREYVGEHVDNMKGKKLFLYTDGLNEAENKEQQQYGEDRLQRQINQHSKDSAQQTIEDIQQDVTLFVNGAEASDDMTILCLTVR